MECQLVKKILLVIFVSSLLLLTALPLAHALAQPTYSLPSGWSLKSQTPYPQLTGIHDPQGAGQMIFEPNDHEAIVAVNYENSLGATYSNASLAEQATSILATYQNITGALSGDMAVSGVIGGYCITQEGNNYYWTFVFVKGNYYFDIYWGVNPASGQEMNVIKLIDSLNEYQGEIPNYPAGYYIAGAFAVEVAIAAGLVALIVVTIRKDFLTKKTIS